MTMKSQSWPARIPRAFNRGPRIAAAYHNGWRHGHGVACHNVPKMGETYFTDAMGRVTVTAENIREVHETLTHAGCDNSRQFSPFEFTAHEFNSRHNSERLWEAFEAGTADAVAADLATYTDADYGLEG